MNNLRFLPILFTVCFISNFSAQSLRINEVSQGPSGSKEYVELVVTGPVLTNCSSQPQCLDLRGWILDDNNGYFSNGVLSGTGVASGAVRFSSNAMWQCVNPGTIILIYNDNDPNASVPAQDLSITDGNCKLVIPISSNLFERHESAPSNSSMAYATTGWVSGGNWNPISMANGDDSFQVYAPTNTTVPVHGVSWGNNNSNNFIYFAGAAGGTVYSCTNAASADFSLQSNWASSPVASGQTPGIPNSTQNSALLSGMNLNCGAPLVITVTPQNETCQASCNGAATITISGGIPPYQTPVWSNGTTANQVSNLCPGNYSVQVQDAGGCSSTQNFTISSDAGFTVTTSGNVAICEGQSTSISASGATSYTWNNGLGAGSTFQVTPTTTTTYTVTGTSGGCTATASLTVTVNPSPVVDAGNDQSVCTGSPVTLTATGADTYAWDNGVTNGVAFTPAPGTVTYTVIGTANGCTATDQVTVTVGNNITVDAGPDLTVCNGQSIILTATGADQYTWSSGIVNGQSFVPGAGINIYTVTGTSGTCSGQADVTVIVADCGWVLEMPNVFTPNGDQKNDLLVPVKQANITVKKFEVFNRWGNLVFESSDAQIIAWNGKTQSGEEANYGVYFYKLSFVDGTQVENNIQGFVHLIRE